MYFDVFISMSDLALKYLMLISSFCHEFGLLLPASTLVDMFSSWWDLSLFQSFVSSYASISSILFYTLVL